ncbi:MAG: hypothetical protein KGL18_00920 [Burkholderiales bacterium]|nr:hypothetical protein [Burkholderiales bacterium]MDE1928904.1 hypothetical protein [Burkholderiales bacterium]MDE2160099.1 hypothetical protein [Burkholderiales bacterium]MDE2501524.1 hypothetical protein [Burkholderiales bacterium]
MPQAQALAVPLPAATELPLQQGRRLALASSGGDDLIEVRGADGALELRIRLTPEGPVLQMESLRLSLKAAQQVEVDCGRFAVRARGELELESGTEARVVAPLIRLN